MTNTNSPDARLVELQAAFTAACTAMGDASHEADIAPDNKRKQEAFEAAQAHHDEVINEICNTPATTIHGIATKLEAWQRIEMWIDQDSRPLDELDFEVRAAVSALRDARRLAKA